MILLRMRHIRQCGYCSRGIRTWAERHGINYIHFLQYGIDVEIIEKFDDAFAKEVCQVARAEHAKQSEVNNG